MSLRPAPQKPDDLRPLAFFGDIHGALDGLDAVLGALEGEGVTRLHAAGDLVFGGPEPLAVWRRLEERKVALIRGASDTALTRFTSAAVEAQAREHPEGVLKFLAAQKALGELVLERIRRLPETLRIPLVDGREIVMVHGSPGDPLTEMSHDLSDEALSALVADDPADIVVCAATHVPFVRDLGETMVVNVGAVGASPEGRVAHFTLITPAFGAPIIEQRWLEY